MPPPGALLPGSLVAATVRDVLSDGVVLSFLTFFSGTVDPFHLNEPGSDKKRPHRCAGGGREAPC